MVINMILADKIIRLRKKNGLSQEELADKLGVSRQAVSKWESAQSTPDLDKILKLAGLFGVTCDYLLKDEIEDEELTDLSDERPVRKITLSEAGEYIESRTRASFKIAAATFLCIIAVIPLLLLGAASETGLFGISENFAAGAGLCTLLMIAAVAVVIFVLCGFRNAPFEFLSKEPFEREYGVIGMVKEKQRAYRSTYVRLNVIGTCLCVLSPIPLFAGIVIENDENDFFMVVMLTLTMLVAGIGVVCFIIGNVREEAFKLLLKEGEFSPFEKKNNRMREAVSSVYWMSVTAIYLAWSFVTNDWEFTWIVWPVAGILFSAVMTVLKLKLEDKDE